MDYEKKYNEALERARMILCNIPDGSASINDIETIFPELAESEDERMIKAITHILYENYTDAAVIEGVEIAEIVTWLEKRKPMYNLEIPAGDVAPAEEDGPFDEDEFLDNELSAFLQNYDKEYDDDAAVSDVARHFYELGLNARKEDKK